MRRGMGGAGIWTLMKPRLGIQNNHTFRAILLPDALEFSSLHKWNTTNAEHCFSDSALLTSGTTQLFVVRAILSPVGYVVAPLVSTHLRLVAPASHF